MTSTSYLGAGATAPAGGTAITTTGSQSAGMYGVTVTTSLTGTTAAGDLHNMQLQVGATVIGPLLTVIPTATGVYQNPQFEVLVPSGGAAITVNAIGAGTAAAVYKAHIVLNE